MFIQVHLIFPFYKKGLQGKRDWKTTSLNEVAFHLEGDNDSQNYMCDTQKNTRGRLFPNKTTGQPFHYH